MTAIRTEAKIILKTAIQAWIKALDGQLEVLIDLSPAHWPDEQRLVTVHPSLTGRGTINELEVKASLAGCYHIARYSEVLLNTDNLAMETMFLARLSRGRNNVYRYSANWQYEEDKGFLYNANQARVASLFKALVPVCEGFNDQYDNLKSSEPIKVLMFLDEIVHAIEILEVRETVATV